MHLGREPVIARNRTGFQAGLHHQELYKKPNLSSLGGMGLPSQVVASLCHLCSAPLHELAPPRLLLTSYFKFSLAVLNINLTLFIGLNKIQLI